MGLWWQQCKQPVVTLRAAPRSEISELMNILNDVHGRGTANPNGFSSKTPHYERALQHFEKFSKKKHSSVRRGNGEEPFVTNGEFIEFSKNTPSLLWPAFRIQTEVGVLAMPATGRILDRS